MTLNEACEQYLLYAHPDYAVSGESDHALLWWNHVGRSGHFTVSLQPWPRLSKLSLSAEYPDDIPADRLAQIMELTARVNSTELCGLLLLDPTLSRLRMALSLDVGADGVLDVGLLGESLAIVTDAMDSLMPCIRRVCAGKCSALQAYEDWDAATAREMEGLKAHEPVHPLISENVMQHETPAQCSRMDDLTQKSGWRTPGELLALQAERLSPVSRSRGSLTSLIGSRSENQDYGLLFRCGHGEDDPVVMAIADGLGGHPGGRAASYLACRGVIDAAASAITKDPHALQAILRQGAESTLSSFAMQQPPGTCLTTLIIAVATPDRYELSWIGDGGAAIRRSDGQWLTAMTPHRGPSGLLNEVGAFLGANRHGYWSVSSFDRLPGDLLVVGTDGVMERTLNLNSFFKEALQRIAQGVSVQDAMTRRLENCVERHPLVFDDNLTLASLYTPAQSRRKEEHDPCNIQ